MIRLIYSCSTVPAHLPPYRDFHIFWDDRTNRHKPVPAACLTLWKKGERMESRDMAIRETFPYQPTST